MNEIFPIAHFSILKKCFQNPRVTIPFHTPVVTLRPRKATFNEKPLCAMYSRVNSYFLQKAGSIEAVCLSTLFDKCSSSWVTEDSFRRKLKQHKCLEVYHGLHLHFGHACNFTCILTCAG